MEIPTGVYTNIVDGLVVTGGKSGLVCTKSGFNRFSRIIATNNTSTVWGEGRGIGFASDYKRFNVYSETIIDNSYVADNKTGIANGDGNDKMKVYLVNDTVCRNSDTGVTGAYSETYFCNCIVSGNANYGMALNYGSSYLYDSCFYGTTTAAVFAQPGDGDKANWWSRFNLRYRAGTIRLDPRLGADGRPLADSLTLKRGTARFADKVLDQTDVLGQPWNGSWDMGCFKSAYPIADTVRYADVYVAEDGDDANTGSTPQDPVRTLALGVFRTATNGTCHLGPGSFTAPAVLDKDGLTLVGAGAKKTTVIGLSGRNDTGLAVAANDVTIRDLRCDNGREGVTVAAVSVATNTMIRDCRFVNQRVAGVRKHNEDGAVAETTPFRVSHCTFTNCCWGIYCSGAKLFADNSLFTFNGLTDFDQSGAVCTGSSTGSHAPYQLSQCTLVDNVCGIYSGRSFGGCLTDRCAYNCILSGNMYGYKSTDVGSVLFGRFYNCLFENETDFANEPQINENPVYADPKFVGVGGRPYRLASGSPAIGAGCLLTEIPDLPVEAGTDLLGRPWKPGKQPNLGCYGPGYGLMMLVR